MRKFLNKILPTLSMVGTTAAYGLMRVQTDSDYDWTTTSLDSDYATGAAAATGLSALFGSAWLAIMCVGIVIGVAALAFNIWMIIDCSKREFENKTLWLVLLIAGLFLGFGFLASIIYFFAVRGPMNKGSKPTQPAAPTQQ